MERFANVPPPRCPSPPRANDWSKTGEPAELVLSHLFLLACHDVLQLRRPIISLHLLAMKARKVRATHPLFMMPPTISYSSGMDAPKTSKSSQSKGPVLNPVEMDADRQQMFSLS